MPPIFAEPGILTAVNTIEGLTDDQVEGMLQSGDSGALTAYRSQQLSSDAEGKATVYRIVLPEGATSSSSFITVNESDNCYVFAEGGNPVTCSLDDPNLTWDTMGKEKVYRFGVRGGGNFVPGSSVYLLLKSKKAEVVTA